MEKHLEVPSNQASTPLTTRATPNFQKRHFSSSLSAATTTATCFNPVYGKQFHTKKDSIRSGVLSQVNRNSAGTAGTRSHKI